MVSDEPRAPASPASDMDPSSPFAYREAAVQTDGAIFIRTFNAEASVEVLTAAIRGLSPEDRERSPRRTGRPRLRLGWMWHLSPGWDVPAWSPSPPGKAPLPIDPTKKCSVCSYMHE